MKGKESVRADILIDCSPFWKIMSMDERSRMARQLSCSWSSLRRAKGSRLRLHFVGFDEALWRDVAASSKDLDPSKWPTSSLGLEQHLHDAVPLQPGQRIIYLVPDQDAEPLDGIEQGDVIVIGGFVDRPLRPGVSRGRAESLSSSLPRLVATRRLPIYESTGLPFQGMTERYMSRSPLFSSHPPSLFSHPWLELGRKTA
jgi:Trm5-related predicted tRNA methylase